MKLTKLKRGFHSASLRTRDGNCMLRVRVAQGFWMRFRGLMLTPPLADGHGLFIPRCASVHCLFMRYAIDLVYVDDEGRVLQCVANVRPWAVSAAGRRARIAAKHRPIHTLELAAGSIEQLAIAPGDLLDFPRESRRTVLTNTARQRISERGSSMTEFVVVGPIITLLGLAIIQYGLLFFAKNQINHASFMAARAGSVGNASLDSIESAFSNALIPLYGGGQSPAELAAALGRARADLAGNLRIEILNPTRESFDDWNAPALQAALNTGAKRVIPNSNLASRGNQVGPTSGQTIQDANLIKVRITHGYAPKVPIVSSIYQVYLKWLDTKSDSFHSQLVAAGRIPVVTTATLQMQSSPIEGSPVSFPGAGNGGSPSNPGDPPLTDTPPPECATVSCTPRAPPDVEPPVDPGGPCTGTDCPVCNIPPA